MIVSNDNQKSQFWDLFVFPVSFAFLVYMSIRISKNRPEPGRNLKVILNGFMSLAYLGSGLVLLLVPGSSKVIGPEYIKVLSVSLLIYGLFRGVRAYFSFMNSKF